DPRTYEFAERQARAALRLAEAQLEQAHAQIAQAEADLASVEATQQKSALDVARYVPLAGSGAVTQQEVDNAVQTNAANLAAVKAARANLANAQAGVTRSQADIERLRAALGDAQLNTGWTKVLSPITGIAGIKNANIGDLIEASTPLTTISKLDPIYVQIAISEQEYLRWSRRGATERLRDLSIVLADGTVDVRKVQLGQRIGSFWIVEQGVKPGERVVVEGLDKVRAGAKVKLTVAEIR